MQELVEIFVPTKSVSEIVIRGSIGFLALVLLLRLVPKRNAGHISPNDMLIIVVIGALGANAIGGGSHSLGDILMMIALVLAWGYVLDRLEHHFPAARKVLRHDAAQLVENGRMLKRNMRRELVTEEELRAALRREGFEDISSIRSAILEADGEISFIRFEQPG
jgi:uncharacterized membrane protein YcaP (DUF421 family)